MNKPKRTALAALWALFATGAFAQIGGAWTGTLDLGPQQLTLVFRVNPEARTITLDVPQQGAQGLPARVNVLTDDSVSLTIDAISLNYRGKLVDGKINGTFSQFTLVKDLILTRGEQTYARPQEPKAPFPYIALSVGFDNKAAGVRLSGTLTYPVGYRNGVKVPVVLLVTGSGPQNRDEELFRHKPFWVLADALARAGIASLRYDDRGVGQSTGTFAGATTFDFAADAAAGLDYLRRQGAFSKVGLVGHSEGGLIAYLLAAEQKTDFVVSMAGPATRVDTLMYEQLNALARVQGAQGPLVKSVAQAREFLLRQDSGAWTRTFLDIDMAPYLRRVTCPVLALNGSHDLNVPATLTLPALRAALPASTPRVIREYPGLNHLFQHAPTGNPTEYLLLEETLAPEVITDLIQWIQALP